MVDFGRGGPAGAMAGDAPGVSSAGGGQKSGTGGPGGGSRGGGGDQNNSGNGGSGNNSSTGSNKGKKKGGARLLGTPNYSRNRRLGNFNPEDVDSQLHPDELEPGFFEALGNWLGFTTSSKPNYTTKEREFSVTGFDPTDSGLVGGILTVVNPIAGAVYGLQRNLRKDKPIAAGFSVFGGAHPVLAVADTVVGIHDFVEDESLDEKVAELVGATGSRKSVVNQEARLGVSPVSGNLSSPPERDGGYEPIVASKTMVSAKQTNDVITNKANGTPERYLQSKKLGPANIRRRQYSGAPLLGVIDALGHP